jgi:hypothetical protein
MSLEGYVDAELKDFKKGLFVLQWDTKTKLQYSDLADNVGGFDLKKVEATLVGTANDALQFKARGADLAVTLQNPEKAKEDLAKKAKDLVGKGKTLLRVSGTLREVKVDGKDEKKLVLDLDGVEAVEPPKKK